MVICLASYKADKNVCYLASSSKDSQIRVWKIWSSSSDESTLADYKFDLIQVCQGHTQDVGALAFSKQAFSFLVSGSIDTTIKMWRVEAVGDESKSHQNKLLNVGFTVKAHENDINCVCVSPNDKLIASASTDKTAKVSYYIN